MIAWVAGRLLQAVAVVFVMTVIVFAGLHAIGNPVDILISPEADQAERARVVAALGLDRPLWMQYGLFLRGLVPRRSRPQLRVQRAGAAPDRRAHAGDAGTGGDGGAAVGADRIAVRPLRRPASGQARRAGGHGGERARLQPADLLGRADAHPRLRRAARMAAEHGARGDRAAARGAVVVPDLGRSAAPRAAGRQSRLVQHRARAAPDAGRRAGGDGVRLRALRARQGTERAAHRARARAADRAHSRSPRSSASNSDRPSPIPSSPRRCSRGPAWASSSSTASTCSTGR